MTTTVDAPKQFPSADAVLLRLGAIMTRPYVLMTPDSAPAEANADADVVGLSLLKPHSTSASVLFASEAVDGRSLGLAVIKQRTNLPKVYTEHLNYVLSRDLGFGVVAAALPVEVVIGAPQDPEAKSTVYDFCVEAAQEEAKEAGSAATLWYGTIEACQRVRPAGGAHAPGRAPWLEELARSPMGCANLRHGLRHVWRWFAHKDAGGGGPAPALGEGSPDLPAFLGAISQGSFERLALFCMLTCQSDTCFENLMLTTSEQEPAALQLVLIDTTHSLPAEPEAGFVYEPAEGATQYWYPEYLLLPHALRPLSEAGRAFLRGLALPGCRSAVEWGAVPAEWQAEDRMAGVARRLEVMQRTVLADPEISVRGLAFKTVPCWERDMAAHMRAEGLEQPVLDFLCSAL